VAQSNGEFQYKIVADAKAAIKNLGDFAKQQDRTTQQVTKSVKRQVKENVKLDQKIIKTRAELAKTRAEFKKYTTTKKADAELAKAAAGAQEQLTKKLNKQTEALRKGKEKLRGYNRELERNKRLEEQVAQTVFIKARRVDRAFRYPGPIGPQRPDAPMMGPGFAGDRGFRGQVGRRAGFSRRARNLGSQFAGGAAALGNTGLLGAAGSGLALQQSISGAVDLEQQRLKLQVLSKAYGEYDRILQMTAQNAELFNKSQRDSTTEFANVYARLRPLGFELSEIQGVYKGFNSIAIASGATANASRIAFMQLAQALGSGRLAGDEFRSVSEQIPGVLIPIAREMGVTVGELKKLGSEGKITSDVLVKALSTGFADNKDKIKELLDLSPGAKFTALGNAISDLAVAVGDVLLPVVLPVVEALTRFIKTILRLPGPLKTLTLGLGAAGLGFMGVSAALIKLNGTMALPGVVAFFAKAAAIGLIAAPFIGVAMAIEEAARKTEEFNEALSSDDPEIMGDKIEELKKQQEGVNKAIERLNKLPFYQGKAGDVHDLKRQIAELQKQIDALTERRTLIIDIVMKTHTIGGIDYKMDGPGGRLVPINPPETVSERKEREARELEEGKPEREKAARLQQRIAKIESEGRRRLAELDAKQAVDFLKQRYNLQRDLERRNHAIAEANLTGIAREQLAITNARIQEGRALQARQMQLDDAVTAAERRVDAARQRLAEAAPGLDTARAQNTLDRAVLSETGARNQADQFRLAAPLLDQRAGEFATAQSTAGFRDIAEQAGQEAQALRTRNRLLMEGVSPARIEAMLRINEIDRNAQLIIQNLNQTDLPEYNRNVAEITEKAQMAKDAVNDLTLAQEQNAGAIGQYIGAAQEYVSNIQARIVDIASTIEQSIADAITGLVNGTMTATEAFHSFFKSVGEAFLKMAAQMIAKLIIINLLKSALGGLMGGGPMPSGVQMGDGGGTVMSGLGTKFGTFGPNFGIAQPMATGGIVTKPTKALIGEGGMNEAVVPLPNGRSIPVDFGKNAGGGVTTNITVNVDQGGGTTTQTDGDQANKLGLAIDTAVKRVIMDERRVGGLLYNGRR